MSKNNEYRKIFRMDKFARRWYCHHARLNQLRSDKKLAKKSVRDAGKRICRGAERSAK